LLDTIYGNFKWQSEIMDILIRDVKAFDEEEIGIRNFAVPLHFASIEWGRLSLDTLSSVTLVIEDSVEPYWQDWDGDTVLVAPATDLELRRWEKEGGKASVSFEAAIHGREKAPVLNIAAIRRGDTSRALSEEDRKCPAPQGPRRPHIDHDFIPSGVAQWDRYDL
jgi:hypothetical protein